MSQQGTFEYRLPSTTFGANKQHIRAFEEMITRFLNAGFTLQGPPFIEGSQIYQPMVKDKIGVPSPVEIGPEDASATVA